MVEREIFVRWFLTHGWTLRSGGEELPWEVALAPDLPFLLYRGDARWRPPGWKPGRERAMEEVAR
jgi:hypothetical protein